MACYESENSNCTLLDVSCHDKKYQLNDTLKRNPKQSLTKSDLLNIMAHLEGELQSREIVVAVLKSEKLKQILREIKFGQLNINDPYFALYRDSCAIKHMKSDEKFMQQIYEKKMEKLNLLIHVQKNSLTNIIHLMEENEKMHQKIVKELELKLFKLASSDVKYLQDSHTNCKQEIEFGKAKHKYLEEELKKSESIFKVENEKQKQIILYLIFERNELVLKWLEEKTESEKLSKILSEEKRKVNCIAEDLEEEIKKSLEMEHKLEQKNMEFDLERKTFQNVIVNHEHRIHDLEQELDKAKIEVQNLKQQLEEAHQVAMFQAGIPLPMPPIIGTKSLFSKNSEEFIPGYPVTSSLTKTIQPTAAISSIPVTGPATGIAHSIQTKSLISKPSSSNSQPSPHLTTHCWISNSIGNFNESLDISMEYNKPVNRTSSICREFTNAPIKTSLISNNNKNSTVAPVTSYTFASAKKLSCQNRGIPPPIPPNKPVILPKKDLTSKYELGYEHNSELIKKLNSVSAKDKVFLYDLAKSDSKFNNVMYTLESHSENSNLNCTPAILHKSTISNEECIESMMHVLNCRLDCMKCLPVATHEILIQELADFHQLFFSMVQGTVDLKSTSISKTISIAYLLQISA